MFRKWGSIVAVAVVLQSATTALADPKPHDSSTAAVQKAQTAPASTDSANHQRSLAPGSVAGVRKAQSFADPAAASWLIGAGIVIGGAVLLASGHGHGHASSSTTGAP